MSSGRQDKWFTLANEYLRRTGSPDFPDRPHVGYGKLQYASSDHVETKYAAWVCETDHRGDVMVVINNKDGVCGDSKPASQTCVNAVRAMLYDDQAMIVYYPENPNGVRLQGTLKRK
ncbi:DddA-like double-stranded DNA deaminase toxin [Streptomyces sp. NPDC004667]|uniref:DddA-like double-stranded DNA deaminase toxin n=1 Tax=Streptomyces sp. NPDC004667 TaxID=3154285 RepID=UPI0033A71886